MSRTCTVRLPAMALTLSVRSFQVPATPLTSAWPPSLPFGADFAGHAGHLAGEGVEVVHHLVDGVLQLQDLALDVHGDLLRQVAVGDGRGDAGDVAHLGRQAARHGVDVVRQPLPGAGHALDFGLAAELALGADFAGHAGDLAGEGVELSTILLMVSLSCRISPLTSTVIFCDRSPLAMAVATRAMSRTWAVRLPAMALTLSVRPFHVPATPLTSAWPPSLPFGADLAGHAGHLAGEGVEVVHHLVDGVLELQDLALGRPR